MSLILKVIDEWNTLSKTINTTLRNYLRLLNLLVTKNLTYTSLLIVI